MGKTDKNLYQCEECGLHYEKEIDAKACAAWCRAHNSCNLEITSKAIENKERDKGRY